MPDFKFSCPNCDQHISADESWSGHEINCPTCKARIAVPASPSANQDKAPLRIQNPAPQPPVQTTHHQPASTPKRPRQQPAGHSGGWSGLAIVSFVTGLIGCLSPVAVICGHLALGKFKKDPSLKGKWMAITGLVLGYLGILLGVLSIISFSGAFFQARKEFQALSDSGEFVISESTEVLQPVDEATDAPPPPEASQISGSTVSGKIEGRAVTCGYALARGSQLEFRKEDGFETDPWIVFFLSSPNRTLEGLSLEVPGSGRAPSIHVHYKTDTGGGSFVLTGNYTMRLEFGEIQNGKLPGKVYLKAESPKSIELEGSFEAVVE